MATVVSRTIRSNPHRDGIKTWQVIVDLLTQGKTGDNSRELLSVSGIAASLITDQFPKNDPIVVICDGPRTRIYCTYDENAIDGTGENEDPFGFDPLKGSWTVSLPCHADDLDWVQAALKKLSTKITARDLESDVVDSKNIANNSQTLTLDPKGFLGS